MQGLGGAGGSRDHGQSSGASAAKIFVREIQDDLVIGIGMDRGHGAALDNEVVVNHLRHRSKTVGGTRRVGDDVMLRGIVFIVVHAKHDSDVLTGGGSR